MTELYAVLNEQLKQEKISMHQQLKKEHRKIFLFMDVCVVLIILFNMGALATTNALVLQAEPNKTFAEVNPAMAKLQGFEEHPQAKSLYLTFMIQAGLWLLIALSYGFTRLGMFKYYQLVFLASLYGGMAVLMLYDFVNDVGFYIGKLIWGL